MFVQELDEQAAARVPGRLPVEPRVQSIRLLGQPVEVLDGGVQFFREKLVHHLKARQAQSFVDGHQVYQQNGQDDGGVPQRQAEP